MESPSGMIENDSQVSAAVWQIVVCRTQIELSLRTSAHAGVAIPRIFRNVQKTDKRPNKPS